MLHRKKAHSAAPDDFIIEDSKLIKKRALRTNINNRQSQSISRFVQIENQKQDNSGISDVIRAISYQNKSSNFEVYDWVRDTSPTDIGWHGMDIGLRGPTLILSLWRVTTKLKVSLFWLGPWPLDHWA